MPFDSDVALVGTGLAPLVAAAELATRGLSSVILNPDFDFFLEDSELPLDPMLCEKPSKQRLTRSLPESAVAALRPGFPGAVEFWPPKNPEGFHDPQAPYVRQRSRLWIAESGRKKFWGWDGLDELYVEASDAGLHPQIFDSIQATRRFPGYVKSAPEGARDRKGLMIPKACDVDVNRYRAGLLEFAGERLGPERLIRAAGQIDLIPEGIRFYANGAPQTARIDMAVLVFWTPRLTQWVNAQAKKLEARVGKPKGIRLWEEWSLISRDPLEADVIGMFNDVTTWADIEGAPGKGGVTRLSALRSGPLLDAPGGSQQMWASGESFATLEVLFREFLGWEYYSVRSMKPRAIFEWNEDDASPKSWTLRKGSPQVEIIGGCDGPIVDVVSNVRRACERFA